MSKASLLVLTSPLRLQPGAVEALRLMRMVCRCSTMTAHGVAVAFPRFRHKQDVIAVLWAEHS